MMCQLDKETFTCCVCKGKFKHIDGTWLPTGRMINEPHTKQFNIGMAISLTNIFRKPEPETSEHFTCYDCIT
jgi:hypothetical protein